MGMNRPPEKCFITDSPTENYPSEWDLIEYFTEFIGHRYLFRFDAMHENSQKVNDNKHVLKGLFINECFPDTQDGYYNNEILERIIDNADIPRSPDEKLVELLHYLHSLQKFEGEMIDVWENIERNTLIYKLYFRNYNEYWFYLKSLKDRGFIAYIDASSLDVNDAIDIRINYTGLEFLKNKKVHSSKSKTCFIAMWFDETETEKREKIKRAVEVCGFVPQLIDELHYESDLTINDAILRFIQASSFVVADFSGHRHGVYFETGYSLGLGKPLIYMCSKEDFGKTHFDTNHYPHLVYRNLEELQEMLTKKINALIKF